MDKHQIDYKLYSHYNTIEDCHKCIPNGYIIKIFTEKSQQIVKDKFNLQLDCNKDYRFEDKNLYDALYNFLIDKGNHLAGVIGSDDWGLYASQNRDYWESIYGKGFIEKQGPFGKKYYRKLEELKYE